MKKIFALSIIIVLLCTGCGSNITVTTEQNDLIAEYVSGVLLKYSFEDQWQYNKLNKAKNLTGSSTESSTTASPTSVTNSTVSNSGTTSNTVTNATTNNTTTSTSSDPMAMIGEGLGIGGAKITYSNYVVASTYPEGDLVLSVPANVGQKVIAIEFEISNPTATAIVCNKSSDSLVLKLLVNNEVGISESFTILKNDIINMNNVTINPGSTYTAVAIFMIPESKAKSVSSLSISVALNGGSSVSKKLL